MKTTQKDLKSLVAQHVAVDITAYSIEKIYELKKEEAYFVEIAYSAGTYGCNGGLYQGYNTRTLYAITDRTNSLSAI